MSQPEAFEACLPVLQVFGELRVDYLIGGSMASSYHGMPRSTQDVDLVADLRVVHIPLLTARLKDDYYIDPERIRQAIRQRSSFNVLYLKTMFKIDVFVLKDEPFAREEMRRRRRIEVAGTTLEIASAEDTVLQKLIWYRRGGESSEKQWKDLLGVIKVSRADLDSDYLDLWAERLEISDLLERAREDAGW